MHKDDAVAKNRIHTIDLNFMGIRQTIASYLIPHQDGAVLVETGPGSTLAAMQAELDAHGYTPSDITDVLLTHIHLDHAGAAGWFADKGACVHVHSVGAPHMMDPEKLLSSAGRIYGDMMEKLWGEFLPVPKDRLNVLNDGDVIQINELKFRAIDTPGHAEHHFAYLFEDVCFSGDIGGVRLPETRHIRVPMPPPEFMLEKWRTSLRRLKGLDFSKIAPTHFGIFTDIDWHLSALEDTLDEFEVWMAKTMPTDPDVEDLKTQITQLARRSAMQDGVDPEVIDAYETANPSWMSAYGIQRYWRKYRSVADGT
jgi:glyoxylase-like metal-dependent hydrolase (beta-lactamase superfamily II)